MFKLFAYLLIASLVTPNAETGDSGDLEKAGNYSYLEILKKGRSCLDKIETIEGYIKKEKEYDKARKSGDLNAKRPEHEDKVCFMAAAYGFEFRKDTGMVDTKKAIEASIKFWEDSNPEECYVGKPKNILTKDCAKLISEWASNEYNYVKDGIMYSASLDSNHNEKHINVMESFGEPEEPYDADEKLMMNSFKYFMRAFAKKFPNYNSKTKNLNLEFWWPKYPSTSKEYNMYCGSFPYEFKRKLKNYKTRVNPKEYKERLEAIESQIKNCKSYHDIISKSCSNTYIIKEKMVYAYETTNCEVREVLKEDIENDMKRWRMIGATEAEILKHSQLIDRIEECEKYYTEGMRWKYHPPDVKKGCKKK